MVRECSDNTQPHQISGWVSLCCPARAIRDCLREAIIAVYKHSQQKFKRLHRLSVKFEIDYWIIMLALFALPIFIFVQLYDWVEWLHHEDDYELGPGVNKYPRFMGTAFGVIIPYAMLVFRIFRVCPFATRITAHGVLFIGCFLSAVKSHTGINILITTHLHSLPSLMGLAALLLFLYELGFVLFRSISHIQARGKINKALHLHMVLGIMTNILVLWTIMTGLALIPYYLFYLLYHEGIDKAIVLNCLGVYTVFCFLVGLFATAKKKYKFLKNGAELSPYQIFKYGFFKNCCKRKIRKRKYKFHGKARSIILVQ